MEFKDDGLSNVLTKEQLAQMTDKQIEEMATVYSEGNPGLKELLIYCAKNQIPTFASCGGHPDKKDNDPYIAFILDDSTTELFSRIFEEILKSERNISMDKFDTINRLGIHVNKENPEIAFKNLKNNLENFEKFPQNENFNKLAYIVQHAHGNITFFIDGNPNGKISNITFSGLPDKLGLKKMPKQFSSTNEVDSDNINIALDNIIKNMEISNQKENINPKNKSLENLLQYCSEHEISVFTSRGVTINGKADKNFIVFLVNDKDKDALSKLFLMQLYEDSAMNLWKYRDEIRLGVYFHDSHTESKFAQIQNCFEEYAKNPNTSMDTDLFKKMTTFLKKDSSNIKFSINGLPYARKENSPLLMYWGYEGLKDSLPKFLPINGYLPTTDINPYNLVNRQFDDLVECLENPEEEHIREKSTENPESLANVKDFCKKVSYRQMGLNMLNSFITKIKNFGKTKDDERSKPWTR